MWTLASVAVFLFPEMLLFFTDMLFVLTLNRSFIFVTL